MDEILNLIESVSEGFPSYFFIIVPRMDDCIANIGHAKYVTKFNLLEAFWQIPLTERATKFLLLLHLMDYFNTKLCHLV